MKTPIRLVQDSFEDFCKVELPADILRVRFSSRFLHKDDKRSPPPSLVKYLEGVKALDGYGYYAHEKDFIDKLINWAREVPGIVAPVGDTEDKCDIKAALLRAMTPIYGIIKSVSPESKESADLRALKQMLCTIFSRNYCPQAVTEI